MIAHILGARPKDRANVRAVARMGLWSVMVLWLPLAALLLFTQPLMLFFGQKPSWRKLPAFS